MASKNTLFNYFKKVNGESSKAAPKTGSKEAPVTPSTSKRKCPEENEKKPVSAKKEDKNSAKKNCNPEKDKSPSSDKKEPAKKRRRIVEPDDDEGEKKSKKKLIVNESAEESGEDSADDWKPKDEETSSSEEEEQVESSDDKEASGSEEETPRKKNASSKSKPAVRAKPSQVKNINDVLKPAAATAAVTSSPATGLQERTWQHLTYDFLKPDKIRDADKRRPDHPDYNPRTLYVPPDFIKKITPAMKQWWDIKSRHYDCVIFLKLGKFYELYHMDAVIGVNELGLIYMKHPDLAHSGFPEAGYARYSKVLVEKGYKVARVEQTETPDMMQSRCKKMSAPTKFDKVVQREVCQITSKGTRMYLAIEGDETSAENAYLLAITEKKLPNESNKCEFGICFVDTSLGTFCVGQFIDDRHKSELRTLLAHYPPAHVLVNRGSISEETRTILTSLNSSALIENLAPNTEFWTAAQTLKVIHEKNYFKAKDENEETNWPEALVNMTEFKDLRTPKQEQELAVSALGGCLWYLIESKLDSKVLESCKFSQYSVQQGESANIMASHMIMDSTSLLNLDVVANSETGGREATLLAKIDNCCTPFGKRLLHEWLCNPLCAVHSIKMRQQAVSALMQMPSQCEKARKLLNELPDLERLLMRISVYGSATSNHPDSRAIFYEDFSKKKIQNLVSLLQGFKTSLNIVKLFQDGVSDAVLLQRITCNKQDNEAGQFPDLKPLLQFFENAFDSTEALNTGKLAPRNGVDPEFEAFKDRISEINKEIQEHLKEMKTHFGTEVKYVGTGKNRFQIEVPDRFVKKVPLDFQLTSSRKGFKRYYSSLSRILLTRMLAAEDEQQHRLADMNRRMFARFAANCEQWQCAAKCLGILDVLLSFAKYGSEESTCMPVLKFSQHQAYIKITNGRLPTTTLSDFIPNDTMVGMDEVNLLLLTGPNMGGKSTLMRQLGLIVILAQIGCPVPADECVMSPIDRIFTRLGAQDHILAGESTFFVEMSETSAILKHATPHSLVLMDELGRGTTTFDGAAIASAVLKSLVDKQCCTIFSTHYHFLVEKYSKCPKVSLVHMACMEEEDADEEEEAKVETVTFLYKLAPGACPSSHGFNAARLAGLPTSLVTSAKQQALKLQCYPKKVEIFQKMMQMENLVKAQFGALLKELQSAKKWSLGPESPTL